LSEQNFLDEFGKYIGRLNALGVSETTYRTVVRAQLCSDRLTEILTEERALSTTAPQASLFVITATTEEAANEMKALIDSEGYLAAWNTIMSRPDDLEATESPETDAFELLWRTRSSLETSIGADVAAAAFDLDIDVPSDIIAVPGSDGTTNYLLVMVSGREERELSESEFQTAQSSLLQSFIDEQLTGKLQINDMWRSRVPTLPALDPKFLAAPTPTPAVEDASPTVAP